MNEVLAVGIALVFGMAIGRLAKSVKVPAVAGYVVAGLLLGSSVLNWLNDGILQRLGPISDLALGLIAFGIGGELKLAVLKRLGSTILTTAFFEASVAFALVTGGILLLHQPVYIALLLGAVASATAPAATVMVLNELKASGPLAASLRGIVAIDDAICLMIYAIAAALAKAYISGAELSALHVVGVPLEEIGLSLLLGAAIGYILVWIYRRKWLGSEVLPLVLAAVFVTDGAAMAWGLSPLLANMAAGCIVVNISSQKSFFTSLEGIQEPIFTAFFVLAGARLNISLLPQIGVIGIIYTLLRMAGKFVGAAIGSRLAGAPAVVSKYVGFGLFSQIGVAIGLAITIAREFTDPYIGNLTITILLATTVVTEIVGPVLTKWAVIKAGEAGQENEAPASERGKVPLDSQDRYVVQH